MWGMRMFVNYVDLHHSILSYALKRVNGIYTYD